MSADIQVPRMEPCERCKATGAEPEDGLTICPMCRGRGEVLYQQSFLSVRRTCTQCNGRGQIIRRPCKECKGEAYVRKKRKLKINIPAGVDNGTPAAHGRRAARREWRSCGRSLRGHQGEGTSDLRSRGNDLHCTVPVNVAQAALGVDIDVLTFDGLKAVKIPEGSQHGSSVRLRGLGVPDVNGRGRGDILVHVEVYVPNKLTREQRRLLEQLRDTLPAENEPKEKGLLDKVKDYFM